MVADYKRPDPDALLERVTAEELTQSRGKLKIFLGYVAGVGKTFAMLEAAHLRKEEGVDVVIAYIETHGRKETEKLLSGLEIISRQALDYHGAKLSEMDLDATLVRHPQLALVDELAHSNAPGSRHPKRYQDVEELLSAGIDVYTTVNIQHLESLNDVIQQITGVVVHETIPDRIVDDATEIELVDLPTDELLQRLRSGKVYVPEQAARALEKFFRQGNLTTLRELSLRRAADRVDTQMLDYMQTRAIPGPWPASERILVTISSHPLGERLVRAGRRLANDLNAEWFVLFVETPGHVNMPPQNRQRVQANMQLAQDLGAKVYTIPGPEVAPAVLNFAHEHNITKIIAGKPLRSRWLEVFRGSVIDQIIRHSGKIDVYVVSEETATPQRVSARAWVPHRPWDRYLMSVLLVVLITMCGFPLHQFLDPTNLVMLYLAAVVIAAVYLGRGPATLASFLSVVAFDFFFVNPRFSFAVTDTQYLLTFAGLLIVGLIISNSAARLREQVDLLRQRNRQAQALNDLSRELTGAATLDQVLSLVVNNISDMFQTGVIILLPENRKLARRASTPGFILMDAELAVADWAFKNGKPAGRGTDTLPSSSIRYIPLKTVRGAVGVLGIRPNEMQSVLTLDQRGIMDGYANLSALAIERVMFSEQAAQTEMLHKTEQLQTALLNSISHELRTPLASITGVLTSLSESEKSPQSTNRLNPVTRLELIDSATEQANELNHLVENLLDMTRLEAGAIHIHQEPGDVQDLIGTVLQSSADRLGTHPVRVEIPDDLPLVPMDAVLVGQVLTNLIDNACKYSEPANSIVIAANLFEGEVRISVCDQGLGIPTDDLERIFNKFYRVQHANQTVGTGLGLSICKGLIEAHGGRIWAQNNAEKGAILTFTLPI